MGAHSTGGNEPESLELLFQVNLLIFDMNTQITELASLVVQAEETGAKLLALETHDNNVMAAANGLSRAVRERTEELITQYRVWIQGVEDYRELL